jgi:hypothetical protein
MLNTAFVVLLLSHVDKVLQRLGQDLNGLNMGMWTGVTECQIPFLNSGGHSWLGSSFTARAFIVR